MRQLAHTRGADDVFIRLVALARERARRGADDALIEWRNATACDRGRVRPDGYGLYRREGRLYGFFLEYDRGTMGAHDYAAKLNAYADYLASGRFAGDYVGFPTILFLTEDNATEERIARIARAIGTGRSATLPILLTCQWRVDDPRNPLRLLGPIWREPADSFHDRRPWLPMAVAGGDNRHADDDVALSVENQPIDRKIRG